MVDAYGTLIILDVNGIITHPVNEDNGVLKAVFLVVKGTQCWIY